MDSVLPYEGIEQVIASWRDRLLEKLHPREDEGPRSIVNKLWIPLEEGNSKQFESVIGIDGSGNRGLLTPSRVAFLTSAALVASGRDRFRSRVYQAGIIDDYRSDDRVATCREILELKMALAASKGFGGLIMLDGSLFSIVERGLWATPYGTRVTYRLREILPEVEDTLGDLTRDLRAITLSDEFEDRIEVIVRRALERFMERDRRDPDEVRRARFFLEKYEKLKTLNALLEEAGGRDAILVAVAKRSSSRIYFGSPLPDMEYVEMWGGEPGYLSPMVSYLTFPEFMGMERRWPVTLTYAKLSKSASPLRIEVVGKLDPGEVGKILSSLSSSSVDGYPVHLMIAHDEAKVTKDMVDLLIRNLRSTRRIGREVVDGG